MSALALVLLSSCIPPGTQPLETSTTPEVGRGITRVPAGAECNSRIYPDLSALNWASVTYQFYTICYAGRYKDDVALVKRWLDATLELGRQKYGVARPTYQGREPIHTTVFMPPVRTVSTREGDSGVRYDLEDDSVAHAELYYFTPSAWSGDRFGRLRIPAKDYHPHLITHEMAHVVHLGVVRPGWWPPIWISEGLAEYDGFFYATEYNRTTAIDSLIRYVHQRDREKIFCCRTLGDSGIAMSSIYAGGAVIMLFLAERFGEGIHVELLTTPLTEVLEQRGTTVAETFAELQAWFEQRVQALGEAPWTQPVETPRTQLPEIPRTELPEIPPEGDRGITRVSAGAECNSRFDSDLSRLTWASVTYQLYTICYNERYKNDVSIVKRWLDATLELGRQKYGIARPTYRGRDLYTTVFLQPVATQYAGPGVITNLCCEEDGSAYAEIHYLTPSVWRGDALGTLRIPARDYHPHYVMHEMSNLMHYSLEPGSRLTSWLREGLAEYDGYFYTTAYNRTTAINSLIRYVHKYDRERILCCRTLGNPGIATTSRYRGSAVIMMFLAERFGEGIHAELFTAPLEDLLEQRGMTVAETFAELQAWFDQRARALYLR